ncbi:hypothetical protein [Ligilactobacillus animalis]|uniref:hypothetical protein n=1 Tax=Ligilactobacillus animalis TaxID=1605 RepID=UPI00384A9D8C
MNVIPTNLNDLKEDIRHASPSRLRSYQIQLEAYTAFISVYDGVKGSTEDKINAANKIINDLFLLEMDQLGYYFDRECAETAKTGLEFALNEKYNGKFAKKVKLLPSVMLVSRYGFRSVMNQRLEMLAYNQNVDPYTIYYMNRLSGDITLKGYPSLKALRNTLKIECLAVIEYIKSVIAPIK